MTLYRTFMSVELSPETRSRIAAVQRRMREVGADLRWVREHNLHFTLSFLGEIPAAQVARAVVATRAAARAFLPFTVTVAGLGAFPSLDRPQVIWVGTREGGAELERLAGALASALEQERVRTDARPFRPHITIGRHRDQRQWGEVVRALRQHRDDDFGMERVETITVMESRLTPGGPVYTPREQVPLGPGLNAPRG